MSASGKRLLTSASLLVLPVLLGFPGQSSADALSWTLDQSSALPDGLTYGTVTITTDSTTGRVTFSVDPSIPAGYGTPGGDFGVDKFAFNFAGSSTWSAPRGFRQGTDRTIGVFGEFDVLTRVRDGNARDPFEFTVTLSDPSEAIPSNFAVPNSSGILFAAHIDGFYEDSDGQDTHHLRPMDHWVARSPHAPAPGAALLGAIGLCLVGWFRRNLA